MRTVFVVMRCGHLPSDIFAKLPDGTLIPGPKVRLAESVHYYRDDAVEAANELRSKLARLEAAGKGRRLHIVEIDEMDEDRAYKELEPPDEE
jgi:hypothetical protein